jgi:hypothetical protein
MKMIFLQCTKVLYVLFKFNIKYRLLIRRLFFDNIEINFKTADLCFKGDINEKNIPVAFHAVYFHAACRTEQQSG